MLAFVYLRNRYNMAKATTSSGSRRKASAIDRRRIAIRVITAIGLTALCAVAAVAFLLFTDTGVRIGRYIPFYQTIRYYFYEGPKMPEADGYGIDISHYQGTIDWGSLGQIPYNLATQRQGRAQSTASVSISFVMIKATEGANHQDKRHAENIENARKAGFVVGAYHVMTMRDGDEQADNFIANSGLQKGDMAPVIDLEESILGGKDKADVRKILKRIVTRLKKEYGVKPIIYCSHKFNSVLGCRESFPDNPLWVARYATDTRPEGADIWQFTDIGDIPGINSVVDLNALYCNRYRLSDLIIKK